MVEKEAALTREKTTNLDITRATRIRKLVKSRRIISFTRTTIGPNSSDSGM